MSISREPPVRVGHPRRTPVVRRASAGLSPLRAGAAIVMLLAVLGMYGVANSSAFTYRRLDLDAGPNPFTNEGAVLAAMGLDSATPNLFLLRTDRLAASLLALPAVTDASVVVSLPDTVRVRIVERQPILVWAVGTRRLLADRDGVLFADAVPGGTGSDLPTIIDHRQASKAFASGDRLDPVDLDAATRFASLKPVDVASASHTLRVTIVDSDGYEVRPDIGGWVALFGFYTPSLRTPDLIPGQVRLLRSLMAGREDTMKRVVLADDRNGSYSTK